MLTLVLVVIFAALVFEFINGFNDTANSIATVVATKVLTPGQAVILAAVMNLIGALTGSAVALKSHAAAAAGVAWWPTRSGARKADAGPVACFTSCWC